MNAKFIRLNSICKKPWLMEEVLPTILSLKCLCLKEKEGNHATFIVTTFSILSNCYWLNSPPLKREVVAVCLEKFLSEKRRHACNLIVAKWSSIAHKNSIVQLQGSILHLLLDGHAGFFLQTRRILFKSKLRFLIMSCDKSIHW